MGLKLACLQAEMAAKGRTFGAQIAVERGDGVESGECVSHVRRTTRHTTQTPTTAPATLPRAACTRRDKTPYAWAGPLKDYKAFKPCECVCSSSHARFSYKARLSSYTHSSDPLYHRRCLGDLLKVWYPTFERNIREFEELGGRYIPSIDITKLSANSAPHWINYKIEEENFIPVSERVKKLRVMVLNFPYAGDKLDGKSPWKSETPEMLEAFFKSSSEMIEADGYVDLRVNMGMGWKDWNVVEIARKAGLKLLHSQKFDKAVFPGYIHRRGCGDSPNAEFPLRDATFFRFGLSDTNEP